MDRFGVSKQAFGQKKKQGKPKDHRNYGRHQDTNQQDRYFNPPDKSSQ